MRGHLHSRGHHDDHVEFQLAKWMKKLNGSESILTGSLVATMRHEDRRITCSSRSCFGPISSTGTQSLRGRSPRVLEPMCGTAEGLRIVERHVGPVRSYSRFDYSATMVDLARQRNPELNIWQGDVTTFRGTANAYDLIILIGGMHRVFTKTREVLRNLHDALAPRGLFVSLEPTHDNWLWRRVRQKVYRTNRPIRCGHGAGVCICRIEGPLFVGGLSTNRRGVSWSSRLRSLLQPRRIPLPLTSEERALSRQAFAIDRLIWSTWLGRKLSFATLSLWERR